LAPIIRSGTGALGSTCFWKLVGSADNGTGQAAAWELAGASLIAAVPPRPLPGQLAEELVEPEVARQPRDRRRPPQAERGELLAHPRIVGGQLHRLAQSAHCLLLVAGDHQRLGEVDQRLGALQAAPQRLLAEADAALPVALDQHQREAVVRQHARVVQVPPPGLLEDLVRRLRVRLQQRAALVDGLVQLAAVHQRLRLRRLHRRGHLRHARRGRRPVRHLDRHPQRVELLGRCPLGQELVLVVFRHHWFR
jgi:hypothetical protein